MRERIGIINEWDIRKNRGKILAIDDSTNLSFNNKSLAYGKISDIFPGQAIIFSGTEKKGNHLFIKNAHIISLEGSVVQYDTISK